MALVPKFVIVTDAVGTTAPCGSVTVPTRSAVMLWLNNGRHVSKSTANSAMNPLHPTEIRRQARAHATVGLLWKNICMPFFRQISAAFTELLFAQPHSPTVTELDRSRIGLVYNASLLHSRSHPITTNCTGDARSRAPGVAKAQMATNSVLSTSKRQHLAAAKHYYRDRSVGKSFDLIDAIRHVDADIPGSIAKRFRPRPAMATFMFGRKRVFPAQAQVTLTRFASWFQEQTVVSTHASMEAVDVSGIRYDNCAHNMTLKGLDLNLLVVLDALLAEKNITRTGERINLSQSATSGALARLREYFNDPLLIQVGQRMELTPLAERLAAPVRELILKGEEIIDKNEGFVPETSRRTFHLNMSDYSAVVVMSGALPRIREAAPHVRLEISSLIEESTTDHLERGTFDLIVTPTELASVHHPSERLFTDQLVPVVWTGNRLVGDSMTLENYLSLGHIVARFSKFPAFDEIYLSRCGHQRRVDVVVSSFSMLITQVIGTQCVATVHERFARHYSRYLPIRILPNPIPMPLFEVRLQWHILHDSDAGVRWLRKMLRSSVADVFERETVSMDGLRYSTADLYGSTVA